MLSDLKWHDIIQKFCPGAQIISISNVKNVFTCQTSVDMILVNGCNSQEVSSLQECITSGVILFDSRIRGKYKTFTRYEGKQSHWLVGGSTDSIFKYTLFCDTDAHKQLWLGFQAPRQPHTDTLLHINSATGINKEHTKRFSCPGFKQFTPEEYKIPQVVPIANNVYHPSGLYPHLENKPRFILPCVFSATGFIKRPPTLIEQCSIWDISTMLTKMLSKLQSIEFWNILTNPIKLLQYALFHTLVTVFGPGGL